jgi:signal transduction histidine kinase
MVHSLTQMTLAVTLLLLAGLTAAAWRYRDNPGARLFGVLQALAAVWTTLALVGLQLPPGPLRLRVWGLNTGMSLVVVAFWLAFILSYTGRGRLLAAGRFGLASMPLAAGAGLYFAGPSWPPLVGRVEQTTISAGTVVHASIGPVGSVLGLYIYLIFLVGLVLVVKNTLEGGSLFTGQALALVLGSLVTVVASFLDIVGIPANGYPITEVALGGQSLLWGYAVFGQQFLRVVPAVSTVGERVAFDELDDGVVVVDESGTVTRANPPARSYFDIDDVGDGTVDPLLERMGVSALAELPTRFRSRGGTYRAKSSPVENWRGQTVGRAVVVQDITRLVRRQQRLEVLARILRHNVRNDMTVVRGLGNRLRERDEAALRDIGETIREKADGLVAVSEKAVELERIFERRNADECVDLDALVGEHVSSLAARHPDATLTTNLSAEELHTDPTLLSLVVEELLTNAVEHAGDTPDVTLESARESGRVEITVTDDGPGIPRTEIAPLVAGGETDLEHASSLGLWLVYWGCRSLGGEVNFDTSASGSTVTLLLPDGAIENNPEQRRDRMTGEDGTTL